MLTTLLHLQYQTTRSSVMLQIHFLKGLCVNLDSCFHLLLQLHTVCQMNIWVQRTTDFPQAMQYNSALPLFPQRNEGAKKQSSHSHENHLHNGHF